jgi:hypothetical protein
MAVRWVWILDRRRDLVFYIGSAVAGWLYVAVILAAAARLPAPLTEALATLRLGGVALPLNLELLVVASWAFLLDAPHVWATLGRTLLDPDEWRIRRREILVSFAWFLLGPAAILLPYGAGAFAARLGRPWPPGVLALGAVLFFVFFRLWAYYHVVRQHWGFVRLYERKAGQPAPRRADVWFFNLAMYLPLLLFMTSASYPRTPGFPDLGLRRPLLSGWSVGELVHPLLWWTYLAVFVGYLVVLARRTARGEALNGSKLLLLAAILPLHFAAFSHPLLAVFVVPLVTAGHNLQYHCIVYSYARSKYAASSGPRLRWARAVFRSVPVYLAVGLAFTFGFYRGPWIDWLRDATGLRLDRVMLDSLGMMAGIRDPAALGLGEQVFAGLIVGFALQHYYLDAKIWRVSRDPQVQRHLRV